MCTYRRIFQGVSVTFTLVRNEENKYIHTCSTLFFIRCVYNSRESRERAVRL